MPNVHRFADWITMESMRILTNTAHFPQFFNREYNKEYQREFPIGDTLRVKLPHRFTIRDGLVAVPLALDRQSTTITDYVHGTLTFTVTALTTAPAVDDIFTIT